MHLKTHHSGTYHLIGNAESYRETRYRARVPRPLQGGASELEGHRCSESARLSFYPLVIPEHFVSTHSNPEPLAQPDPIHNVEGRSRGRQRLDQVVVVVQLPSPSFHHHIVAVPLTLPSFSLPINLD